MNVLRHEGYGYRTQDYYADLRDPPEGYTYSQYQTPWAQKSEVFHEYGLRRYRYDVDLWWRDPNGEIDDEEGVSWHRENVSVWADKPTAYEDVIATAEDRYDEGLMDSSGPLMAATSSRGRFETATIGRLHVASKSRTTLSPF